MPSRTASREHWPKTRSASIRMASRASGKLLVGAVAWGRVVAQPTAPLAKRQAAPNACSLSASPMPVQSRSDTSIRLTVPQMSCRAERDLLDLGVRLRAPQGRGDWHPDLPSGAQRSRSSLAGKTVRDGSHADGFSQAGEAVAGRSASMASQLGSEVEDGGSRDETSESWCGLSLGSASIASQLRHPSRVAVRATRARRLGSALAPAARAAGHPMPSRSLRGGSSREPNGTPDELPGEAGSDRSGC